MNKILLLIFCLVIAVGLIVPLTVAANTYGADTVDIPYMLEKAIKPDKPYKPAKPVFECRDKIDNDGDGYIDWPDDPGCNKKTDRSELNPAIECDDGKDNDGDSAIDYNDAGCYGPTDDDESNCGDTICEGEETCDICIADCGYCDSCDDTDGGNVTTVFGTTYGYYEGEEYSNDDYCVGSEFIVEYWCIDGYEYHQQEGCGSDGYVGDKYCLSDSVYQDWRDYFCSSGECQYTDTSMLIEECEYGCTDGECNPQEPDSCDDTDGGFNPLVKGTASGYLDGEFYSYTDYCHDTTFLEEYYCIGLGCSSDTFPCSANYTACSNGACV